MNPKKTERVPEESMYCILSERLHNLEKNMDFVIDWLEEISPQAKDIPREKKRYGVKERPDLSPFILLIKHNGGEVVSRDCDEENCPSCNWRVSRKYSFKGNDVDKVGLCGNCFMDMVVEEGMVIMQKAQLISNALSPCKGINNVDHQIQEGDRMSEGYNGWVNYETWLLALNVDNDEGLYNFSRDLIKRTKDMDLYEAAKELKEELEELTYNEECDVYRICDNWTQRDWKEIDFNEIVESWREE